jgi:isoprenylcysteine carboxyl methyltransferase (ICMT) family protein YpbQ
MYHILDIFDRHPSWCLSIEVESSIIPLMYGGFVIVVITLLLEKVFIVRAGSDLSLVELRL